MIDPNTLPQSTAADIAKVFSDFGAKVSVSTVFLVLLVVKAIASYTRNFALKNATKENTGPIGNAIAHVAGNSLPSISAPATQTAPPPPIAEAQTKQGP
jgi:hypothetical protein